MPLSTCHQLATDLKAAIDARILGRQAQSVGHKGRNMTYAETPIKDLIAYYNQVRCNCPDALADPDLIAIDPLEGRTGEVRRPAVFFGRGWV